MTDKYAGKYVHCSFGLFNEHTQSDNTIIYYLEENEVKDDPHSFKIPLVGENDEIFVDEGILILENETVCVQEQEDDYVNLTTKKKYKKIDYEEEYMNWEDVCVLLNEEDEEEDEEDEEDEEEDEEESE